MKYSKELLELVTKKEFKTFWHCLDYLLMAGYPPIDAFGVSIKQFGESNIFSSVAFIRMEHDTRPIMFTGQLQQVGTTSTLIVGLIDDTNIHLDGLYTVYRKWLIEDRMTKQHEIENTCEVIKTIVLTPFILDYLVKISKLHFGVDTFISHIPVQLTKMSRPYLDSEPIGFPIREDNDDTKRALDRFIQERIVRGKRDDQ